MPSEAWRANVVDDIGCDGAVTRDVHWTREVRGGTAYFTHVGVQHAPPTALRGINTRLERDGDAPIPEPCVPRTERDDER